MSEPIELLVVVKAYPNVSLRYGEVACVAGIRPRESGLRSTRYRRRELAPTRWPLPIAMN